LDAALLMERTEELLLPLPLLLLLLLSTSE
jgi:hypothetical protein